MSTYQEVKQITDQVLSGVPVETEPGVVLDVQDTTLQTEVAAMNAEYVARMHHLTVDPRVGRIPGMRGTAFAGWVTFSSPDAPTVAPVLSGTGEIIQFDRTRTGVAVQIASTSASDFYDTVTPANSTGAHTVFVAGIDSNGDAVSVYQQVNGTTPTNVTEDGTIGGTPVSWIAVNRMITLRDFSLLPGGPPEIFNNVGDICIGPQSATWVGGKPDVKWCCMAAGDNFSQGAFRYVPNDGWEVPLQFTFGGDADVQNITQFDFYTNINGPDTTVDWHQLKFYVGTSGLVTQPLGIEYFFPGDAFWIRVQSTGGNNHRVSLRYDGMMVPTPLNAPQPPS